MELIDRDATPDAPADDMVRLEVRVTGTYNVFLTQDEYERWDNDPASATGDLVANLLATGRDDLIASGGLDVELERAVLVEADGYLGTDITVLKAF